MADCEITRGWFKMHVLFTVLIANGVTIDFWIFQKKGSYLQDRTKWTKPSKKLLTRGLDCASMASNFEHLWHHFGEKNGAFQWNCRVSIHVSIKADWKSMGIPKFVQWTSLNHLKLDDPSAGGLLSAHALSGRRIFLQKAQAGPEKPSRLGPDGEHS